MNPMSETKAITYIFDKWPIGGRWKSEENNEITEFVSAVKEIYESESIY